MNDRILILMRHAKSSWANDSLADFDRPLNERGKKASPLMARWLEENSLVPDTILCSTALRTKQTSDFIMAEWKQPCCRFDIQALYLASPNTILKVLTTHGPTESKVLLLIGHNPGFETLASMLSGKAIIMPTAAVAVFRFRQSSSWSIDLSENKAHLEQFITVRELAPSDDLE